MIGERVSFSLGSDLDRIAWGIEQVNEVVSSNKRKIQTKPSLGAYLNICVHDDINRAAELVRPGVGIFAHFTGMPGASRKHVNQADQSVFDKLGSGYDKIRHGRGDAAHAEQMPLEFIKRFSVIGSSKACIEKINSIKELGIERIFVIGPRPDHFGAEADEAQKRFAADVIPTFRD
jgi:alkanesulfonate monooxygenase SsuD/methylene tetrahydromethanopterin reductase-like flavin-dependent oxidoreductase (luciferase family)